MLLTILVGEEAAFHKLHDNGNCSMSGTTGIPCVSFNGRGKIQLKEGQVASSISLSFYISVF